MAPGIHFSLVETGSRGPTRVSVHLLVLEECMSLEEKQPNCPSSNVRKARIPLISCLDNHMILASQKNKNLSKTLKLVQTFAKYCMGSCLSLSAQLRHYLQGYPAAGPAARLGGFAFRQLRAQGHGMLSALDGYFGLQRRSIPGEHKPRSFV